MNATLLEISDQTACPSRREVELAALVEKLQKEIASLRAENRQLKDGLFAAKSEKKRPQDRSNGLDDSQRASERRRGHQPGST